MVKKGGVSTMRVGVTGAVIGAVAGASAGALLSDQHKRKIAAEKLGQLRHYAVDVLRKNRPTFIRGSQELLKPLKRTRKTSRFIH